MKTSLGKTCYKFPNRTIGKRPRFDGSVKLKRKTKKYSERILRYWQLQAFKKLFLSKFFLVKAFCGAGKTTLSVVMALYDIIKKGRKQIFIVPQEHIGDGFAAGGVFAVPNLGIVHMSSAQNFCEDSEHKVEMLVNFIKRNCSSKNFSYGRDYAVDASDHIAVCTHSAFNMAIKKIIESGDFDKLKNISFYIDEAHHIKGGDDASLEINYNQLGEIVYKIIDNASKNNFRVGLTTATYFRGDQGIIVKKEFLDNFDRYELDFLEHFETLGIDTVNVNFEEYDEDPIKQIVRNIRRELEEYHLIVVPTKASKWRKNDTNLEKLKRELRAMLIEEGLNPDEVVLDLVTVNTQKINKAILLKEPKEKHDDDNPSRIKIVITCMLGREGTDWCACSRLHNASIELGSTTLAVQTLGRLFRKFHGKTNVCITYYIKKFNELEKCESKRDFLADRVNAMLCLMMIDDLMNPIILPELPLSQHTGPKRVKRKTKGNAAIRLNDVFGDNFENIKRKILDMASIHTDLNEEMADSIIEGVIREYDLQDVVRVKNGKITKITTKENVIAGLKVFLLRARSEVLRSRGIDVSLIRKAGFDYVVEKNKLKGNFWCGLDKEKLHRFTKIIGKCFWSKEQIEQMAENLKRLLPRQIGCEIDPSNRSHAHLIDQILDDLKNFHDAYNNVANLNKTIVPNRKDVAEKLHISLSVLNQKVEFFNKILPKGYWFFNKNSKLSEKFALDFAA